MINAFLKAIKGKKTITSCLVAGIIAVLQHMNLVDADTAALLFKLAGTLGLYGLYDKVRDKPPTTPTP